MSGRKGKGPASAGPPRVLGYVRVSTDEQANSGAGLAAQREAITRACRERGYKLAAIVEDAGFSAKTMTRPGITVALAQLDSGEADALMVAKLDRLSRSLLDFAKLMDHARRRDWAVIALDLGVDTATPAGAMMANVLATFAQFERDLTSERTKAALAQKKAQGVRIGRPSKQDPAVVARIVRERQAGATLMAIAEGLNRDGEPTVGGGKRWYDSTVRRVLESVGQ